MDHSDDPNTDPVDLNIIQAIARASSDITRIAIRLQSPANMLLHSEHRRNYVMDARSDLIARIDDWLGVRGYMFSVMKADCAEEWFWEKPDGGSLTVAPKQKV